MDNRSLTRLLSEAVDRMYSEEPRLPNTNGIEQAMMFRIGLHLNDLLREAELSDYQLDCEYNKQGNDTKRDIHGTAIRPDLLIHRRGDNDTGANKLAVEFKGSWNQDIDTDIDKLCNLTHPDKGYAYQLGVLVILGKKDAKYTYFTDGSVST